MAEREKTPPEPASSFAAVAARGAFATLLGVVDKLLDRWVILGTALIVVAGHLTYVCFLPEGDRAKHPLFSGLADTVKQIASNNGFCILGWVLLVLVVIFTVPVGLLANKRIRDQGAELARLRTLEDPQRISSHEPKRAAPSDKNSKETDNE